MQLEVAQRFFVSKYLPTNPRNMFLTKKPLIFEMDKKIVMPGRLYQFHQIAPVDVSIDL